MSPAKSQSQGVRGNANGRDGRDGRDKKKSLKAAQGAPLPPDGSPISDFPIGSCVLVERDSSAAWYLLMFRIARSGPPFCGLMSHPPSSPRWNDRMGDSRSIPDATIVLASAWPLRMRAADASGGEEDPLMAETPAEGSVMFDHLSSTRSAADEGGPVIR